MYSETDHSRFYSEKQETILEIEEYRSTWRRDYARLIHCPGFRRLQGKTQLFPGEETDFFRNRLTHSIEVSQIAESIAIRINHRYTFPNNKTVVKKLRNAPINIDRDLVAFAGLAHDLGHPPFGHQGEEALDECMIKHGGFEGNAQTLRLLTRIEKKFRFEEDGTGITNNGKDVRVGLNLTYRSLASILKYSQIIPITKADRMRLDNSLKPVKGYYASEVNIVSKIKEAVTGVKNYRGNFKTVECQIMDIADDIAYCTYDLEDGFKAGFFTPFDILFAGPNIYESVRASVSRRLQKQVSVSEIKDVVDDLFLNIFTKPDIIKAIDNFNPDLKDEELAKAYTSVWSGTAYITSQDIASNGTFRTEFTSDLIGKFIRGVEFDFNDNIPALSRVYLNDTIRFKVEVLKTFTYVMQIQSSRLKMAEYRGKEIVKRIFDTLTKNNGNALLPSDYRGLYDKVEKKDKNRVVCDFIAGMTDKYAIEFYGRLTSENPETIFKPF